MKENKQGAQLETKQRDTSDTEGRISLEDPKGKTEKYTSHVIKNESQGVKSGGKKAI